MRPPIAAIYGDPVEVRFSGFANSPQLVIRDAQNRTFNLFVLEDFVVRTKTAGYTTAARKGDPQ